MPFSIPAPVDPQAIARVVLSDLVGWAAVAAGVASVLGVAIVFRSPKALLRRAALTSEGGGRAEPKNAEVRRIALAETYHSQGLSQADLSFKASMLFAVVGFGVILASIYYALTSPSPTQVGFFNRYGEPVLAVVAGTIIDAVAGLFFIQSNKSRALMSEFFDRLRADRKLDESLRLVESIERKDLADEVRVMLSLHFAEAPLTEAVLSRALPGRSAHLSPAQAHVGGQTVEDDPTGP